MVDWSIGPKVGWLHVVGIFGALVDWVQFVDRSLDSSIG